MPGIEVHSRASISQSEYETGGYDLALVHQGNDEGLYIEDGWHSPGTCLVLFSGGGDQPPFDITQGITYVTRRYLEAGDNLRQLVLQASR